MKRILLCLCLAGFAARTSADPARDAMHAGHKAMESGKLDEAVTNFVRAAEQAEAAKLDPAVAHYNQGVSLFRMQKHAEAAAAFQEALRTPDLKLQSRAYFNRGNCLRALAEDSLKGNEPAQAQPLLEQAMQMYVNAMRLDPRDEDAKVNFELARQKVMMMLAAVVDAEQAIAAARKLLGEFKFQEAAALLQQVMQVFQTGLALKPELGQTVQAMLQNTTKVLEILATPPNAADQNAPPTAPPPGGAT